MRTNQTAAKDIDEYIVGFPNDVQEILEKIRMTIGSNLLPFVVVLLLLSVAAGRQSARLAGDFDYPLDPAGYGVNGGYDFLDPTGDTWHAGEDWTRNQTLCDGELGDPVYAVAEGLIVGADDYGNRGGNIIMIEHTLADGGTVWSMYSHLDQIVRDSGEVQLGEQIGTMGKTGGVPCVHLHWEIRVTYLDPWFWPVGESKNWVRQRYVDPTDWVTFYNLTDAVRVFDFSFYRGSNGSITNDGLYNLPSSLNNKMSSIGLPAGWTVTLYRDNNGSGPSKVFTANDSDFSNDQFNDGSPLDNAASSILIEGP